MHARDLRRFPDVSGESAAGAKMDASTLLRASWAVQRTHDVDGSHRWSVIGTWPKGQMFHSFVIEGYDIRDDTDPCDCGAP